jgi:integrase
MLNTGMTQYDLARLRQDEVDWDRGAVIRKRNKTKNYDNVPIVKYKLWPETFRLLEAHRSTDTILALTNANGQPLKTETIKDDGKIKRVDNVRTAYHRLTAKLKIDSPKPPKLLRKTGATLLASNPAYATCDVLYLGHSPQGVAARHYSALPQALFDDAVEWLGQQFGF